jgi:hypothetical protein
MNDYEKVIWSSIGAHLGGGQFTLLITGRICGFGHQLGTKKKNHR